MSVSGVSTVSAPPPVVAQQPIDPKPQDATPNDEAAYQPPPPAPLPPGQGTRIDQFA